MKLEDEINQDKLICQIDRANSQHQRDYVSIVVLFMLSYAKSQKSNVYQMIKSHFTFAYNVVKRCVNILHFISLCVLYKIIYTVLKENAKEVKLKIKNMIWHNRFFIFFNHMNFYEHIQDQCLYNKKHL